MNAGAKGQLPSWRRADITWGDLNPRARGAPPFKGDWVELARIYFSPNEWRLGPDDRTVLADISRSFADWLLDGAEMEVRCAGRADVRGESRSNEDLSLLRARAVATFLVDRFLGAPGVKFIAARALGETFSSASPAMWAQDRRVDVDVHFHSGDELREKRNPFKKYRVNIFKNYYPRYVLWADRGLDYLVEQYEEREQYGSVEIRPEDYGKVLDLISKIADPAYSQRAKVAAAQPDWPKEITGYYEPLYRRLYTEEALPRYEQTFWRFFDLHPKMPYEEKVRIVSSGFKER